jgi:hypothetical protein
MKKLLSASILIALTVAASAQTQPLDRTQEYRMWSAERMVEHLTERLARTQAACNQIGSSACKAAVIKAYPMLESVREIAASGDIVAWANLMDALREFEKSNEAALNTVGRR